MATRLDNLIMTIIPGLEQSLKQQVQSESVKDQILRANGGMYSETNPYGSSGNYDFDSNKGSRTSSNGLLWSSQSNSKPTKLW